MKNSRILVSFLALLALAATGYSLADAKEAKAGKDCCASGGGCCSGGAAGCE
jgi:hypothetical protein